VIVLGLAAFFLIRARVRPQLKLARTKADLHNLEANLEVYSSENGVYPPWTMDPDGKALFPGGIDLPSFSLPPCLTTPVAYREELPPDTCGYIDPVPLKTPDGETRDHTFAYWAPEGGGYIVISAGPDRTFDLDFKTLQACYDPMKGWDRKRLQLWTYDPTNGSRSGGDMWGIRNPE
jgi:hypothetical protein